MDSFGTALTHVLGWEGGYVNDPRDPGGETKYGISKRAYPAEDIKNLTVERAAELYKRDYWDLCGCGQLPPGAGLLLFDTAVNCGVKRAKTWRSIANGDLRRMAVQRAVHYALLDSIDDVYAKGWFNRLFATYELAIHLDNPHG